MSIKEESFKYLSPKQHYIDLYDLRTVEDCLDLYKFFYKKLPEILKLPNKENHTEEERKEDFYKVLNIALVSMKTARFKCKEQTINEWINKDERRQSKFDNTEPLETYCEECNILMENQDKTLQEDSKENGLRILFIYQCPKCNKRKAYYDDGELYKSKPILCEKCGNEVDVSMKIDDIKDTTTWIYKCTVCDYKKIEIDNHKKWKEDRDKRILRDEELLRKFRKEFVFSEEEGKEVLEGFENMKRFNESYVKNEEKKKDPAYQKAIKLTKLKVVELNKIIKEEIQKEGFSGLLFEKPDLGKFVVVPFIAEDEKPDRREYDSKKQMKKLISDVLEGTNWRLMSDGINYRVGYLSGKLKCYESEEALINLMQTTSV